MSIGLIQVMVLLTGILFADAEISAALPYLDQARSVLTDAEARSGRLEAVQGRLSIAYASANEHDAAWKLINSMQSIRQRIMAIAGVSVAYTREGDTTRAEQALNQAMALTSDGTTHVDADAWQELAIARLWRGDLDGAVEIARTHRLEGHDALELISAHALHGKPSDSVSFAERVLGRPLKKSDLYVLLRIVEVLSEKGAKDAAAEISRSAAVLVEAGQESANWDDTVWVSKLFYLSGLRDEAMRLLKEAERLADQIPRRLNGELRIAARMIGEMHAALGSRDSAVAQTRRVTNRRDEPYVLAGVAIGLARAGRLEDAFEVAIHLNSPIERNEAVWEIAQISSRMGKPEIATRVILDVISPQNGTFKSLWHEDSSGHFEQVFLRGVRAICRSLAQLGKPKEAMTFINAMHPLSPAERAIAVVDIAEGIIASRRVVQPRR